jgi:hypothetical protein
MLPRGAAAANSLRRFWSTHGEEVPEGDLDHRAAGDDSDQPVVIDRCFSTIWVATSSNGVPGATVITSRVIRSVTIIADIFSISRSVRWPPS